MKTSNGKYTRMCVRLWTQNVIFINKLCESQGQEFNTILREMINTVCKQMEANEIRKIDKIEGPKTTPEEVLDILLKT
jgi:hypothetical protein